MNRLELHGLTGSIPTSIQARAVPSQQEASTSAYASSFFKGLNERAGSFVRSLVGRVSTFFKDLSGRFESDPMVSALKSYFQGLVTTPLNKDPEALDTFETRLAALGEFVNHESLKANRALANLFYTTRAELLNRILGENKAEIVVTTVAANEGRAVSDELEKVSYLEKAGERVAIETPQEIIAKDIERLKARTTAQKAWDYVCSCTFGSNAKKALYLHTANASKLKELIRPKHEEVMKSLHDLVANPMDLKEFEQAINALKPAVQDFLKEGNPFQEETRDILMKISMNLRSNVRYGSEAEHLRIFLSIRSPVTSRASSPTPTVCNSDDSGRSSPVLFVAE